MTPPIDETAAMTRFEELVRDDIVPTRSSERLIGAAASGEVRKSFSRPHRVIRIDVDRLARDEDAWPLPGDHSGWQTLVFDGELPVSTPEIGGESLELATSGNEQSALDLAQALEVARESIGTENFEFSLVRVPNLAAVVVVADPEIGVVLPVPTPPSSVEAFRAYELAELRLLLQSAAREELARTKRILERQIEATPPYTFREDVAKNEQAD